jgi:mannose-6-phosphate isomerase
MPGSPIVFQPIYQQRVWGGRQLAARLGRALPDDGLPYGESWEIVDRPEAQSVVRDGPWQGRSLGELWSRHRQEIFGLTGGPDRFPILCKVLDARDKLSVQVHPPLPVCPQLAGEPKDEVWYLMEVDPQAELYAGLKTGATRADFEQSLRHGGMDRLLHTIRPAAGESIFLPSGRLHAIGAGFLILEIQQNSDTTYRVYDWDRAGLDGKPRQMHPAQAMASTDFQDFEPAMRPAGDGDLARCAGFFVQQASLPDGAALDATADGRFRIVAVARGRLSCAGRQFQAGDFFLLPPRAAPLVGGSGALALLAGLPDHE